MNSADQKNPGFSVPQGLSSRCLEGKSRVFRSIHRKMHLDEIEALFNKGGRA